MTTDAGAPDIRPEVRTTPPPGVEPAHTGLLLQRKVGSEDIAAAIVQMALQGYLTITPEVRNGVFGSPTKVWRLDRTTLDASGLSTGRRELLEAIFRKGTSVVLSDVAKSLRRPVASFRRQLEQEASGHGWIRRSPVPNARPIVTGLAVLLVLVNMWPGIVGVRTPGWWWPATFTAMLVLMGLTALARVLDRHRLTPDGDRVAEHLLGFLLHLRSADGVDLTGPDGARIFARNLPWAVAGGHAGEWAGAFADAARHVSLTQAALFAAWTADLRWFGGAAWAGSGSSFDAHGDIAGTSAATSGFAEAFQGIGDHFSDLASDIGDFASDIGDLASDLSSDMGSAGGDGGGWGDSGGGDGGGGDGGGGGGD